MNEQNAEICARDCMPRLTYLDYETVDKEMNKTVKISQLKKEIYKLQQRDGARLAEKDNRINQLQNQMQDLNTKFEGS